MKISIIVATFNSATTIAKTLESVLAQSYTDYELIICDGASTDTTLDVVASFQDAFGTKLSCVSEPDSSLYEAMNKGVDRASGDIIGFLNSDDFYTSNHILERISQEFTHTPLLEAVYGDVHYIHPHSGKPVRYYSCRIFSPWMMRLGFMPAHPSFYCKRHLFSTYGKFDLNYQIAADFEQLFRLIYVHRIRIKYIPIDFVTMRVGGISTPGLASSKRIMREHITAIHSHGYKANRLLLSTRYIYKVFELIYSRIRYAFSS